MVAYSFQKQFIEPIELGMRDPKAPGAKLQTIRGPRKRHAYPGENLQLYYAMRTKHCRKIIPDPVCLDVRPITIQWEAGQIKRIRVGWVRNPPLTDLEAFAKADGFTSLREMSAFWELPAPDHFFDGLLIKWQPIAPLEAEVARAA
ncbi:hypothetical protein [Cognatishimia sp. MH4019]|uniref:hypothetical protein n=1 Tax=Cognatishimia sp. MH4019 TaxID=2854030 RepID=UPI001CD5F763|nr:hypothetical protein [Cognatishimia sp. MH4019]